MTTNTANRGDNDDDDDDDWKNERVSKKEKEIDHKRYRQTRDFF